MSTEPATGGSLGEPGPDDVTGAAVGATEDGSAPADVVPEPAADHDEPWQRLHPISPFLRGGVMILAVGGYFISQRFEELIGYRWGPQGPDPDDLGIHGVWLILLAFLALVAIVVCYGWLSWRVAKFRVGGNTLEYRWGLLFKQHRQVRYDRIQSVDLTRPLLARLFGLSAVVVQSAGGASSHVELSYLTHSRALQVRDAVLAHVDAEHAGPDVPAVEATGAALDPNAPVPPEGAASTAYSRRRLEAALRGEMAPTRGREVLRTIPVPMTRFVLSLLYHPISVFVVLFVLPGALLSALFTPVGALPVLVPVFFGAVLPHARRFLTEANFSVDVESDRLRITHGLSTQRSNTVPLARIQAVEISQGFFWRWPDWWRMTVTIAGVVGEDTEAQTTAFPVGTEAEVLDLAAIMLPGIDPAAIRAGMRGSGGEPGFTTSSRRSAIFQPWAWRRNGYAVTDAALVIRRGRLARVVSLIPHARVQSMSVDQGPLDRWRQVASVNVDLTAGPVSGQIPHLDVPEALRLLVEQSSRSALARTELRGALPLELTPTPGRGAPATAATERSIEL
ncbi:MAG TPA: PH domain-containing protein [Intrasporangiaceae bacterium]|nr:PH domain-containing protein [Intrasporangiaceae bacterium]